MFSSSIPSCRRGELAETEAELTALAGRPNAGLLDLRFVFWDEELKQVVAPMEKNLRLMALLYPAAYLAGTLLGAALAAIPAANRPPLSLLRVRE